ncbi:helix-turn-helix domain-containing protein [Hymenobacter sp. B81]|uniref:helix-turn-helix domain-containing protein n=1 Tax=Hymenobacter sp. B81 TaxID=3344878 RepID=UPI0037DD520F
MEHVHPIPPHSPLHAAVQLCWQLDRHDPVAIRETIMPKGTVELIFNLNDSAAMEARIGPRLYQVPRCFINGFNSCPVQLALPQSHLLFGVVFQPTALRSIFNVEAPDFSNQCIDMSLVDAGLDQLWHQLGELPDFAGRVAAFTGWLLQRLPSLSAQERFFDRYLSNPGQPALSVAQLSDLLCYSPRHLTRKLQALVGMNTERTLLYKKYLQALHLMHGSGQSLTQIAHGCQFTDQAHFSKTFRAFTQLTPREYLALKSHLPGHIYSNVR